MRQQKSETKSGKCCISIHAPLAGCDHKHSLRKKGEQLFQSTHPLRGATTINRRDMFKNDFNPRTPCGVRLYFFSQTFDIDKFQSTHPLRGATIMRRACSSSGKISIHAPLAGCDRPKIPIAPPIRNFNPRTPCGVRLSICHD